MTRKKVGVVTFHDGMNYGAVLQAVATCKMLRSQGFDAHVIKYTPIMKLIKETAYYLLKRGSVKKNAMKSVRFSRFKSNFFTPRYFFKWQFRKKFDVCFFGADEIWNVKNESFSFDKFYIGDGVCAKKIAFSPSFGSTTNLSIDQAKSFKDCLDEFEYISVRDANSKKVLDDILVVQDEPGFDPVLLPVNFNDNVEKLGVKGEFYLIYASPQHVDLGLLIEKIRKQSDAKIVLVGWSHPCADFNYNYASVEEWLGLFKTSKGVFTSMFHGVCFSIKYRKPVRVFVTPYRKNKFSSFVENEELAPAFTEDFESFSLLPDHMVDMEKISHDIQSQAEERFKSAISSMV